MITIVKHYGGSGNRVDMHGKSTDEKPFDVSNASLFYEMDTKKIYMFDEETKTWIEQ